MLNSFLSEVFKPVTSSVKHEASNIVLAYCMGAVFLTRNQSVEINASHWLTMVDYIARGKSNIDFNNQETATSTFDMISLRTPMSDDTRNFILNNLTDTTNENFVMVESIIHFLNTTPEFNNLVAQVTNNGVLNRIIIDIDNISSDDPNMTSVLIDNEHVRVFRSVMPIFNFRPMEGGIGQKDLTKDYGYAAHRKFLKDSLGLDIGSDSGVYYQTSHNNGDPTVESVELATRQLYEELSRKINDGCNRQFDSPLADFKHDLISQALRSCYGVNTDQDCTCVVFPHNKVQYESFDVHGTYENLYKAKIRAKCPENVNPSLRIVDENNKELFQVRFKKERYGENVTGHRYKMYFKPRNVNTYFKG